VFKGNRCLERSQRSEASQWVRSTVFLPRKTLSHDWPGLRAIGKITAAREISGKTTTETRCYLLSQACAPERFNTVVRSHWGIENQLHWVLDVIMDEDQARNRKDHGPQNLALLRKLALNLAKLEPSKGSMRGKLKRAGWDNAFLAQILTCSLIFKCGSPAATP
jgi:predicted transposase YbfD/YdcC